MALGQNPGQSNDLAPRDDHSRFHSRTGNLPDRLTCGHTIPSNLLAIAHDVAPYTSLEMAHGGPTEQPQRPRQVLWGSADAAGSPLGLAVVDRL